MKTAMVIAATASFQKRVTIRTATPNAYLTSLNVKLRTVVTSSKQRPKIKSKKMAKNAWYPL